MSPMMRLAFFASIATYLLTIIVVVYLVQFDSNPPATFNDGRPTPVTQASYHPGDQVNINFAVCRRTMFSGAMTALRLRQIPEGHLYLLPPLVLPAPDAKTCVTGTASLATVPLDVIPGRYYLDATSTYRVNALGQHSVRWVTTMFDVVAR